MKNKKKVISLILAVLMLVSLTLITGCSSGSEPAGSEAPGGEGGGASLQGKNIEQESLKIAFIPLSTSGVACAMELKGMEDQLSVYPNIELVTFDPQYDPSKQVAMIEECITQGFDAILIEPMDPETVGIAIKNAEDAGIPVCTVNLQVSQPHALGIKGSDYMAGQVGAEELCKLFNDKANIVILDAPAAQMASVRYSAGFEDYLKENNKTEMKIIDYQNIDNWSVDIANQVMRDLITKHGDNIDAVFAASDDLALGAVQAIQAAGKTGKIKVWGAGGFPNALKAIKDGSMYGTSFMDYYQELSTAILMTLYCVQTGLTYQTAGFTETPIIQTPAFACTAENVDEIIATSRQSQLQ
ncbi:MAG: sugar ABC transporter substrate-binding protein [Peptococcaceae bacterium]|nr:sugar ABC transporter substrate-binding protein [Peptococcaceae bacterium]